ncbi:conserved Plasmodium protein, unknown function [Plasmodium reichenowi]|uniref:Uncharacterized protein n=1 Tax=Plasmodium reichenowi TaxID=5854 RepID=A0A060S1D9_PLARE|nr:conserved Plasmodium protein, unknown function [Plasmodium reichenowi]
MSICQFPISNSKGICYRQRTTECVKENNGITKFFLKDLIKESSLKNEDVTKKDIEDKEKKNVQQNEKNQSFNVSYTWETDAISGLRFINVLNKKDKKKLGFQCIYCRDRQLFKKKSSVLYHMVTFNHGLKNSVIDELKINERTSDDRLKFINNFNTEKQITIEKENIVEKNVTKDYNLIKLEIEFVSTMNLLTFEELKELFLFFFPEQVISIDENMIKENIIEKFLLNINSLSENYSRIIEKEYHVPDYSKDLNLITLSEYLNDLRNVKLEKKTNFYCEESVDSELAINETMTSQNKEREEKKMCANQEKDIVETSSENILSKDITEEQKVYISEENRNDKINEEDQVQIKSVEKKDNAAIVDAKNMNNLVIEQNIENVIGEEKKKRKRKEKINIDENKHILININDYNILRHDDQLFISLTANKNKPQKEKTIIGKENFFIINNNISNDEMNKQDNNNENMHTTTTSNINNNNSTKSNNNKNNFHNIYNSASSNNYYEHVKNGNGSYNSNIHTNSNNNNLLQKINAEQYMIIDHNNNNNNYYNENKKKHTMNILLNLNNKEKKKRSRNEGSKETKMNVCKKVRNMKNKNNLDIHFLYEKTIENNVDNQNKNEHFYEQKLINYESIIGIDDITENNGLKEEHNSISSIPNYNIISTTSNTCDINEEFYNNMNININGCLYKQTITNKNNKDDNNNNDNNIINVDETKEQGNIKDSYNTKNNEEDTNILNNIHNDNKIQRIQIQVDDDLKDNKKNISEKNVEESVLTCSQNKTVKMVNYKDINMIDKSRNKSVIKKKEINNKNILKNITKINTLNSNTKGRKKKVNIIETQKDNILKKKISYKITIDKEKKRIINYNKRNNRRKNIIKTTGSINNYYKNQHIDNIINKKKNITLYNKKNKQTNIIHKKCYKKVNKHICTSSIKEIKQLCNLSNENIIPHNENLSCTRSYRLSRYIKT